MNHAVASATPTTTSAPARTWRVLHVLDHSLPVQSGYAYRSAAILREQRRLRWDPVAVTGSKHGSSPAALETVDEQRYYRTESGWGSDVPVWNQIDVIRSLRRQLRTIIARENPDIVQAHSPCLNALAAFGLGKPVVYEMRSSWEDAAVSTGTTVEGSARYKLSRWLETVALRRADAVTTICEGLREEAIRRGVPADRVTVIPNAVDPDALKPQRADASGVRAAHGLGDCFVLGFIGSFFAWEGLSLLIEALPKVLAGRPDVRLLLVGGGVEGPQLRSAVERAGLHKQVIFAGQVPHAQVAAMYAAIDLLVYPRLPMRLTDMVTPLKPLEAMASGKALVASDVGGHKEMVAHNRTGVLFRAGDAEDLARAILSVMNDADLQRRLRENGPRYVAEHRLWSSVVPGYESVYRRLAPGRQS
jgi:glycogen(starch) synthase